MDACATAVVGTADCGEPRTVADCRHRRPRADHPPSSRARLHDATRQSRAAGRRRQASRWSRIFAAATSPQAAKARRWYRHSTQRYSGTADRHRVVVNIGGIANITDLPRREAGTRLRHRPGQHLARRVVRAPHRSAFRSRRRVGRAWQRHCGTARRNAGRPVFRSRHRRRARGAITSTCAGCSACLTAVVAPADVQRTLTALTTADDRRCDRSALRGSDGGPGLRRRRAQR